MPTKSGNTRATRAKAKAKAHSQSVKTAAKSRSAKAKAEPEAVNPQSAAPVSSVWQLTATATRTVWRSRKLFVGVVLVYGALNLMLVQGLSGSANITNLKHSFDQLFHGHGDQLASSTASFIALIGAAGGQGSSSQAAGIFQLFLLLITSLAIIWGLRQVLSGASVRVRDTFYRGTFPLVPFVLVLLVIGLQLLPLVIGSTLYASVISGGIAITWLEELFWLLVFFCFAAISLRMITSSMLAVYIVTLPDMTPLKALRSARELTKGRRLLVLRKLLYLPVAILVVSSAIMLPIIILLTPIAQGVFFILTLLVLLAIHSYLYTLYRELLV